MPKIPPLSGRELLKILERNSCSIVRQSGSHAIVEGELFGKKIKAVIPNTNKMLAIGTLNSIIKKQLQISREQFFELIK